MQFATIQKDQEVLDKALAVSTNTDGTTDWGQTVQSYIELGGSDPGMVSGLAEEARRSDPKEAFTPSVMEVDGVTFAITSKGGAQVISTPDGGEMKLPAGAQVSEYKVKQLQKAREAFSSGNENMAQDIITSLDMIDKITGSPLTPEEIFGSPEVVTPGGTTVGDAGESLQDIIARNLTPNQ